jgi:uncharacterized protein YqjF (DUF2071 family)
MTQTWHNLLFAHWPVSADVLRPLLPYGLDLDLFDGQAWLGVIPFRLSGVRLRGLPQVPFAGAFPEINVRTYVRAGGRPGVYFLSLDTDNRVTLALARPWFKLPYYPARIRFQERGDGIRFTSWRTGRDIPPAELTATYRPASETFAASAGSLEHWLTERYCYYGKDWRARLYRCDIHHPPWSLQRAEAEISENTMTLAHGIRLPAMPPVLLYAHRMQALIWPLTRLNVETLERWNVGFARG